MVVSSHPPGILRRMVPHPPPPVALVVPWDATRVLDRAARPVQLKVKEALHIEKTPANNRLNRDGGYELPGCWIATMKKLGGGGNRASANRAGAPPSAPSRMGARAQ